MASERGNILQRIIRLVFDRNAARKAEADSKRAVSGMDKALAGLKKAALGVGAAIAAAFAFTKIIDGIRSVSRAAIESEKIWNRLAGTLRTVGVDYGEVEGQIQAVARAMQDTTTVGDEQFAEVLQGLITLTGDFESSLHNVGLVADFAAAHQISLEASTEAVGRAMQGNFRILKTYNIEAKDAADALRQMRDQSAGMAQNEARTLGGRLEMLGNEFGDLKEELGLFIADSKIAAGTIDFLTGVIKGATEAIRRLRETDAETAGRLAASAVLDMSPDELVAEQRRLFADINRLRAREQQLLPFGDTRALRNVQNELAVVAAQYAEIVRHEATLQQLPGLTVSVEQAKERAEADQKAADEREKARKRELELLLKGAEARSLTVQEENKLLNIWQQIHADLVLGNNDLETRLQLMEELAQVTAATSRISGERRGFDLLRGPVDSIQEQTGIIGLPPSDLARFDEHQERHKQWAEALIDDLAAIEQAQRMTWLRAGDLIRGFFADIAEGSEGIGNIIVANLLSGFAEYLRIKGSAALIEGSFPPNPALIAKGWALMALSGVVQGLQARLVAGGGSGGTSVSAGGAGAPSSRSQLTQPPPDITLILQGDFDALNPKFVRAVHTATHEGVETIGPGNVRLQTVGGR